MDKKSLDKITTFLVKQSRKGDFIDWKKVKKNLRVLSFLPLPQRLVILKAYKNRLEKIYLASTLIIESFASLTRKEMEQINDVFKKHYKISSTITKINKDLIAGFRVSLGSSVFDYSAARKMVFFKERVLEK